MYLGVDKVYVINLERHSLRREHIIKLFKEFDVDYEFVKGVDWKDFEDLSDLHVYLKDYFFDPNGWFSYSALCCVLAHRKAWKTFLDSGEELGLFFEDDIHPTPYLNNFDFTQLNQDLKELDWGVCFLGKYSESNSTYFHVKNSLYDYDYFNTNQYAAHAYILNRKSAQWYYDNTQFIRYASDIRLEISPFRALILKNSLFTQKYRNLQEEATYLASTDSPLMEFLHHTTEDVAVGEEWSWLESFMNTRCKSLVVNKNLPISSVEKKNIRYKNKLLEGYKFGLNG